MLRCPRQIPCSLLGSQFSVGCSFYQARCCAPGAALFSRFFLISVTSAKPNIIIFLVDDLGIADLGCFGNDTIKTPNIDRLAEEGARLRHDVMPDSICTPNRAALLTGRYPIRSGLGSPYRVFLFSSASGGLPQNEITFAEIASAAGYKTGRSWQTY